MVKDKTPLQKLLQLYEDQGVNDYNDWEWSFIEDMVRKADETLGSMSEKQKEKIEELYSEHYES